MKMLHAGMVALAMLLALSACEPAPTQKAPATQPVSSLRAQLDSYVPIGVGGDLSRRATMLDLYHRMANDRHAAQQSGLGLLYYIGQGVPQNYAEAVKWWRLAADQGDHHAQNNLGVLYYTGQVVPQDYAVAVSLYRTAADQGNAHAENNLGIAYYEGQGVQQDYVQAHKWFNLSAASGYEEALENREIVAAKMAPSQIAEAQRLAIEAQKLAAPQWFKE